eukprot:COSAG03_NODE_13573_length_497_cov_0.982412_1_plen_63_part_01
MGCAVPSLTPVRAQCFVVGADNVGSKQMADIRFALRDGKGNKKAEAVVLMGKNTLIRRTLGNH